MSNTISASGLHKQAATDHQAAADHHKKAAESHAKDDMPEAKKTFTFCDGLLRYSR